MEVILLTGGRSPVALQMARSFRKAGHKVIAVDSLFYPMCRFSNSVGKYFSLPHPRWDFQEYLEAVLEIVEIESITCVIPTNEEAFYVAQIPFPVAVKVWTTSIMTMDQLHNKYTFIGLMSQLVTGVTPVTFLSDQFDDYSNIHHYILKPVYSRFADKVKLHASGKSFVNPAEGWIVQQKIIGEEVCVYSIWDSGKLKAYSSYVPFKRAGKGAGTWFRDRPHERIRQIVSEFGCLLNYTGQLSFDVILQDDVPYFIECNPRGTSGAHLLGENIADAFLEDKLLYPQETDICLKIPTLLYHPQLLFRKSFHETKDPVYCKKDKKPFYSQLLSIIEFMYRSIRNGVSILGATTYDMEWNGKFETKLGKEQFPTLSKDNVK